jgi:YesN/AraC family two-component response regulator
MLSASAMSNIRTAMNRGAFDFLTKPIDFLDFETTLAKTIRHVEVLRDARWLLVEAERAHASLSRYFSPNLAEQLASDADAISLSRQHREIATLFTDNGQVGNFNAASPWHSSAYTSCLTHKGTARCVQP